MLKMDMCFFLSPAMSDLDIPYPPPPLPLSPDLHWINPGGRQPLPTASHLRPSTHQPVQRQEAWGRASSHLCRGRQCLLFLEERPEESVCDHQRGEWGWEDWIDKTHTAVSCCCQWSALLDWAADLRSKSNYGRCGLILIRVAMICRERVKNSFTK